MPVIYDFKPQVEKDTFEGRLLTIKRYVKGVLMDLTGASAVFEVFREGSDKIWFTQNCTILSEPECLIQISKISAPVLTPYNYSWRVRISYANGDVKTYIGGQMPIVQLKTNDSWQIQ